MQKALLAVENLHKTFVNGADVLEVLRGITVSFSQGSSYGITGVSGSGKSTFIHLIAGMDNPTSGTVSFNGQNLASASQQCRDQFLRQSIGLVFQTPYLIAELSVLENVMIRGLLAARPLAQCEELAMELLNAVGIADKASCRPLSLSGGQQQRVALARAMFCKPAFLIADEPTGSLDEHTGRGIVELLLTCQHEWQMGIIVSSHDDYVTQAMNNAYQIKDGIMTPKEF
jgi:ABC-type lipoprotein export system ATPase subunit